MTVLTYSSLDDGPRQPGSSRHPLSVSQEQLWYLHQLAPERPAYHEVLTIEHDGRLDAGLLGRALSAVIARHDAWHSTFHTDPQTGEGYVRVAAPVAVDLPVLDLGHLEPGEADHRAGCWVGAASALPYRLDVGPMIRPRLVRMPGGRDRLYLAMHHIVFDAASVYRTVLPELVAAYDMLASGRPVVWDQPATSYRDFALWERTWVEGERARQRLEWWAQRLQGAEPLALPLDRPRPASPSWQGATIAWDVPPSLVAQLKGLARGHRASLFHVLATALAAVLARYCDQDEVLLTVAADTRQRNEHRKVVGYCVTPVVVRVGVGDDPTFTALLGRVRNEVLDGLDHLVPFERVVRSVAPPRAGTFTPLFSVATVFEPPMTASDPAWRVVAVEDEVANAVGAAKTDLDLSMEETTGGGLRVRLIYDTAIWDGWRAEAMARHWGAVLTAAAAEPSLPLSQLPLVGPDELRRIEAGNATDAPLPDVSLTEEVRRALRARPGAVAVRGATEEITSAELDRWADAVGGALVSAGVGPGEVVAVCVPRGVAVVAAILGVLRAGAVFLPLDVRQPVERLVGMVGDAGAAAVLTGAGAELVGARLPTRSIELPSSPPVGTVAPVSVRVPAGAPGYVMFTSGSTGRPKGTVVFQSALRNVAGYHRRQLDVQPGDPVLAMAPLSADTSMLELFMGLVAGALVVLAPDGIGADPAALQHLLDDERITVAFVVPTALRLLVESGWPGRPGLVVAACGEALPPDLAEALLDRRTVLFNSYGPTEATVAATLDRVEPGSPITIGRPIDNVRVAVVGRHGGLQPIGVPGELVIAGVGVAGGYLGLPALTTERFVPDPTRAGSVAYRTGDLARWLPDGRVEYLGRRDDQVKLRGHRVELGEVAHALRAVPGVEDAAAVVRADRGIDQLVAYVTGSPPEPRALRAALAQRLPAVMVPSVFVTIDRVPVTASGKLDRAALPPPPVPAALPVAPMSPLEARVAAVWQDLLEVPVGVDDDFFDLGGHSLLALRLLERVRQRLGVSLAVPAMLDAGRTVRTMAARIAEAGPHPVAATGLPVLHFIFPNSWGRLAARHFQAAVEGRAAIDALQIPTIGWRFDTGRSIEAQAAGIVATVRAAQPAGPYLIGGYSFGGVMAYEVATQLRATGADVELLLLDALAPTLGRGDLRVGMRRRERAAVLVRQGMRASWRDLISVLAMQGNDVLERLHLPTRPVYDWKGCATLIGGYAPEGNDAPVVLLATGGGPWPPDLGWSKIHSGRLDVVPVPGQHDSVLQEPNVSAVARLIAEWLFPAVPRDRR